ncbi:MAG: hypothetical protein IID37_14990 [Planctomycetes bacterium]|nr:hypothetical protein [Planctomycetota bacterium]
MSAKHGNTVRGWTVSLAWLPLLPVLAVGLAPTQPTMADEQADDAIVQPSSSDIPPTVVESVISEPLTSTRVDWQTGALIATLDANAYDQLRTAQLVQMTLPVTAQGGVITDLRPVQVATEGARAQIVNGQDVRWSELRVAAFSGRVRATANSYVFIALTPHQVAGYVLLDGTTYLISSGDPRSFTGEVTIATADSFPAAAPGAANPGLCHLDDALFAGSTSVGDGPSPAGGSARGTALEVRIADIFIECQHDYTALFNTPEDAADYAAILVAVTSDIYRRDTGAELRIPDGYIRVWETDDEPWGPVNDWGDLAAFISYWEQNMQDVDRTLAHLLTYPVFGGIAASIGGLCSHSEGYALSSVYGFFPTPVQHTHEDNWDMYVFPHELGHNFGSHHTFYCGDGDKGYCPPIECVEDEDQPDGGTLMSYCGVPNIGLRFHPRVQETMREYMTTVLCMEIVEFQPGDYDHNGVLDEADLLSAAMCIYLPFEASGCYETFELDGDAELTPCDYDLLYEMIHPDEPPPDCNDNGEPDACGDIANGLSEDCNLNMIPDECETLVDCNGNGEIDTCDILSGFSGDVNINGIPDECEEADRVIHVDDDGPFDPAPGDPRIGDPDEDGSAEHPFDSIQEAIDDANDFMQILEIRVADGVYTGAENRSLNLDGRELLIGSANGPALCIIDCQNLGRAFDFDNQETGGARIEGFTFINGSADNGAALRCDSDSSPSISRCIFTDNVAEVFGGAIYALESNPTISGCVFQNNSAGISGGALYFSDSESLVSHSTLRGNSAASGGAVYLRTGSALTLRNCELTANIAEGSGGSIFVQSSDVSVLNSTLSGNLATAGGAIYSSLSTSELQGSILWDNQADDGSEIRLVAASTSTVNYCDVAGGPEAASVDGSSSLIWGDGNLDADPWFADADAGDYHLTLGSAAIDAGDPTFEPNIDETDLDGDDRVLNGRIDMGSDEFDQDAEPPCDGDANGDGLVDPLDVGFVLSRFGCSVGTGDPNCDIADQNGDGLVDPLDAGYVLARFGDCL